jgi:hypothetical protein
VMGRVAKVEVTIFSSGGWESSCLGWVAGGGCADSML